jgi:hypothetical protein
MIAPRGIFEALNGFDEARHREMGKREMGGENSGERRGG